MTVDGDKLIGQPVRLEMSAPEATATARSLLSMAMRIA
jgi:hypothetical protein